MQIMNVQKRLIFTIVWLEELCVLYIPAGRTHPPQSSVWARWTSGWMPLRWASIRRTSPVVDTSAWILFSTSVSGTDVQCFISVKWNTQKVKVLSERCITFHFRVKLKTEIYTNILDMSLLQLLGIFYFFSFYSLIIFPCLFFPSSELAKMGVTLAGHQKKILSSVQSLQTQGTHVQV